MNFSRCCGIFLTRQSDAADRSNDWRQIGRYGLCVTVEPVKKACVDGAVAAGLPRTMLGYSGDAARATSATLGVINETAPAIIH